MTALPPVFEGWFAQQKWAPYPHQRAVWDASEEPSVLLVAPTGAGKTLAGFLPTLSALHAAPSAGLHTIYVSPLKALARDIARNLARPINELGLDLRVEDRTGDTAATQKKRQRVDPPHILLTTPESLALLLSYPEAEKIFDGLKRVIIDEIHALAESKRGDQLFLCLSRLRRFCPGLQSLALSATIEDPFALGKLFTPPDKTCKIIHAASGPAPDVTMLATTTSPPWAGNGAGYAIEDVLDLIKKHRTSLIFHNTRAQAEIFFHRLWLANESNLPIAIHHGSLAREARQKVEAAMEQGDLRAVVCTGSLDLGIDWGAVDLVVQIGAPKNIKRLVQRIGRANHSTSAPSKAVLVPANRFELIECLCALEAVRNGQLDGDGPRAGGLDVLCQHILICACNCAFDADKLYAEITSCGAYEHVSRALFDQCLDFCATGGYALRRYDQWQRLQKNKSGLWQLRDPRAAARIRMNIGTIIDQDTLKVRLSRPRNGAALGEIEESFAAVLNPGDTFLIGGETVRFDQMRQLQVMVSREARKPPKIASFMGTKFATSLHLSELILAYLQKENWPELPDHTRAWLNFQKQISQLPQPGRLLIESFAHAEQEHLVVYGFAGRNAQQTLGLILTKRLEEMGLHPLGFVATDYATLVWGLDSLPDTQQLLERDTLLEGIEKWLAGNAVMKRSFRDAATIAGLIEQRSVQGHKSGGQTRFSSDILYDTLQKYDPDHLIMRITRQEAMRGLVDFGRVEQMLLRIDGRIDHRHLPRMSPLAAPLFLEAGRVPIHGAGREALLASFAEKMLERAEADAANAKA